MAHLILVIVSLGFHYHYATGGVLVMDCGQPSINCPEDYQHITCVVGSGSMQWESSAFASDIEFFGSSNGTVKKDSGGYFKAVVSNKTAKNMTIILMFPSLRLLNGKSIKCLDFYDGKYKKCWISVQYPDSPSPPVNLTNIQTSPSAMMLAWDMESVSLGHTTYNVTLWSSAHTLDFLVLITNTTSVILQDLRSYVPYFWQVTVDNCMGSNESLINHFEVLTKVPTPVSHLDKCVFYSTQNMSYIAVITWKASTVDPQFQSPVVEYTLYITSDKKTITFEHASSNILSKYVEVSEDSVYNITVSATSKLGESIANPSVIFDTKSLLSISVLFTGRTYTVLDIIIASIGCEAPSVFNISFHYDVDNKINSTKQNVLLYHMLYNTSVDQYGKSCVLQNLLAGTTYLFTVYVYEGNKLIRKPVSGSFATMENTVNIKKPTEILSSTVTEFPDETELHLSQTSIFFKPAETKLINKTLEQIDKCTCSFNSSWLLVLLICLLGLNLILLSLFALSTYLMFKLKYKLRRQQLGGATKQLSCDTSELSMTDNDAYSQIKYPPMNDHFRSRYLT